MDLTRERSNLTIDTDALKRTWYDINGMEALSVKEIDELKQQMKDAGAYPKMDYYFMNRIGSIPKPTSSQSQDEDSMQCSRIDDATRRF